MYLDNFTYENAISSYSEKLASVFKLEQIEILAKDSLGYVLAKHIFDKVSSKLILPKAHKISALDIGVIINSDNYMITVYKPFEIGILENSNAYMINAFINDMGFRPNIYDENNDIINLINENDIVIINSDDFEKTKATLEKIGDVLVHGIAINPAQNVTLAIVNNKMVVSFTDDCYIVFEKIIKVIINNIMDINQIEEKISCMMIKTLTSPLKYMEFIFVKVFYVNDRFVCMPLARDDSSLKSSTDFDGILEIPKQYEGFNKGENVTITLNKSVDEIKNKIVCFSENDLILDFIKSCNANIDFTNVGSLNAIESIKKNECLIASINLDETMIKDNFVNEKIAIIKGVRRKVGLVVKKGNPLNIKGIKDIPNIKYINHNYTSYMYNLIDDLIKKENISKKDIDGFNFGLKTHFDVCDNVKNGDFDCGFSTLSFANRFNLDFIEIYDEEYNFIINQKDIKSKKAQSFIQTLKSAQFIQQLGNTYCYEISNVGEVILLEG